MTRMRWLAISAWLSGCSLINHFSVADGGPDAGSGDAGRPDTDVDASTDAAASHDAGACPSSCMPPTPVCDDAHGECVECRTSADCDDNDLCAVDRCDLRGMCEHIVDSACVSIVSAGGAHTCALHPPGPVRCWGRASSGQLGDGTSGVGASSTMPVEVRDLSDAVTVGAAGLRTCSVRATGAVVCWGGGPLGDGTTMLSPVPRTVLELTDAVEVSTGSHSCALREDGTVACWGGNHAGQLGDGTTMESHVRVAVLDLDDAVEIAVADSGFTCARRSTGSLACWGANFAGQLGDGTRVNSSRPLAVLDVVDATQLSAGSSHACVVHRGGRVACWGSNADGQLGDGSMLESTRPILVADLADIAEVRGGEGHTCARRAIGEVVCWGRNTRGQLGDGTTAERTGVVSTGIRDAVRITAGDDHSCAIRTSGTVMCWGDNLSGQLGDGTLERRLTPVEVVGL